MVVAWKVEERERGCFYQSNVATAHSIAADENELSKDIPPSHPKYLSQPLSRSISPHSPLNPR
jgi:hypothetical protein